MIFQAKNTNVFGVVSNLSPTKKLLSKHSFLLQQKIRRAKLINMTTNISELKNILLQEKARLEGGLSGVGYKNPEIEGDWQPSAPDLNNLNSEQGEVADRIEAFAGGAAVEVELEARLLEVTSALARMEANTYGICSICGSAIEDARLHANPAATTCIAHREG